MVRSDIATMRILIFSNLYRPEPTGIGPMTGELADGLSEFGHDVHVIAANPSYPDWKLFEGYSPLRWTRRSEGRVEVHRCPVFVPAQVSGKTRILHYSSFAAAALFPAMRLAVRYRPDLVIMVAPTLIAAPVARLCAQLSRARTWLHIQDFEVEAGFATGELTGTGAIGSAALRYERAMLNGFDRVSSISSEMCAKLVEKGVPRDKVFELRNWARIEHITPQPNSIFRERWNIGSRHVALYSGSIAKKQGIETIVDAARLLAEREDLLFVICGNGPRRQELRAYAAGLENIQFHDLQAMEDLNELLNLASIHLLPQRRDAADLVLPSKLANMLASGRPVVAGAQAGTGLAREVEGAGINCEPEDGAAMAAAIEDLLADEALRKTLGETGRARAVERWSKREILSRFDAEIRGPEAKAQTT